MSQNETFPQRIVQGKTDDDEKYLAFRTSSRPGSIMTLKLVPAEATQAVVYIPYLQPITIELHPTTGQICLLCHSSHSVIFIEGDHLDQIAEAISEKRVMSVHVYDEKLHGILEESTAIVRKITFEK